MPFRLVLGFIPVSKTRINWIWYLPTMYVCYLFILHSFYLSSEIALTGLYFLCIIYYIAFAVMLRLSINWKSIHKTCFYFLVQYTPKCINFTHLSHKPIKLCVIYSKWKKIILGINRRGDHIKEKVASWSLKPKKNNGIAMFNASNEGTGGLGISYSSRKMHGKVLNFI